MPDDKSVEDAESRTLLCGVSEDDWHEWNEVVRRWRVWSLSVLAACCAVAGVAGLAIYLGTRSPAATVVYAMAAPTAAYFCWRIVSKLVLESLVRSADIDLPLPGVSAKDWEQIVRRGGAIVGPRLIRSERAEDGVRLVATDLDTAAYRRSSLFSWDKLA